MISGNKISEYALQLRENFGLSHEEPIQNLITHVQEAGYQYVEESFGNEFSGFSRSLGRGNFLIGFNADHDWGENFKRFTISHELGHVSMIEHQNILFQNGNHYSLAEFRSDKQVEKEADLFAIHFLAPKESCLKQISGKDFTRKNVINLSGHFTISSYAAALRFVEVTDLACVLVVCNKNGFIDYEKRSPRFKDTFTHDKINTNKVSNTTLTYEYLKGDSTEDTGQSNLQDWYPSLLVEVGATESVIELKYNEKFLVLITPDVPDIDEYIKTQRY